jgi:hypothetical protein
MHELRDLIRVLLSEALDPTDPTTWARFVPTGSMVELWHVVNDAASLADILGKEGLLPGAQSGASSAEDGSPADLVYFFTKRKPAVIMARKLRDSDAAPAVLRLRVSARMLGALDPRVDPEEEFGGDSVGFLPDPRFALRGLLEIYADDPTVVPARLRFRVRSLADLGL